MSVDERDIRNIIAEEVETTSWRLRETIRVREIAATHRLGQMRRLLMLGEQKAWKREVGFDRIETAAEMDAQRFRTSFVLESFYELLRMEVVLSQTAPRPQCDPSPRRLPAVGTESEKP